MRLSKNDKLLQAQFGGMSLVTNLIDGTYPRYKEVIPKVITANVKVKAVDLEGAVRQVAVVARSGNGAIRLNWTETTMTVSAMSGDAGKASMTISVSEGSSGQIAINEKYLLDYLKGKDGLVNIELSGGNSPAIFRYEEAPTVLMMPMLITGE